MAQHAEDVYGNFGSVPQTQAEPAGRAMAEPMHVQASAVDFGGQVGGAVEKLGKEGEDLGLKYAGMINETAMTQADANFAVKLGQIKADYMTKTGSAAYNAFPQYQKDIQQAFQESRTGLPLMAQHGFDMMATRTMANHIADGSSYAASQLKEANRSAYSDVANANIQALLDPNVAADKERSQYHLDTAAYAAQAQLDHDHPGFKTDPDTGTVSFDESTPEGQVLKSNFQQRLDSYLSQGYVNRYTTLMNQDIFGAHAEYQRERDSMPASAKVQLDATFGPRLTSAHAQNVSGFVLAEAHQDQFQQLTNPSSVGSTANNLGNVKTASGAQNNTQEFVQPATPADGALLAANNLRGKLYQGKTLSQIGHTWTSTEPDAWIKNVSTVSGIAPDQVPDLNDPSTLHSLLKGIAVAEGKDKARFSDDVIAQGVQASLAGKQPQTTSAKSYATNENGGIMSLADYYRTHSNEILIKGDEYAERTMPGDLALKRAVRETLVNQMHQTISNQSAQYTMDNKNVMKAINGDFSNGKPPETEAELRAIPGMSNLLDKVAAQDAKFSEGIPTMIAKMARRNDKTNSPNGFETVMRVLEPDDGAHPNAIRDQDRLDRLLGRSDGTGINMRDYKDAKAGVELPDQWKTFLRSNMEKIAAANGNVDGKGPERALAFYTAANELYKTKTQGGVTLPDLMNPQSKDYVGIAGNYMPSRASQISNTAQNNTAQQVSYREGQTATNPKTGEKLTFRNGVWQ